MSSRLLFHFSNDCEKPKQNQILLPTFCSTRDKADPAVLSMKCCNVQVHSEGADCGVLPFAACVNTAGKTRFNQRPALCSDGSQTHLLSLNKVCHLLSTGCSNWRGEKECKEIGAKSWQRIRRSFALLDQDLVNNLSKFQMPKDCWLLVRWFLHLPFLREIAFS